MWIEWQLLRENEVRKVKHTHTQTHTHTHTQKRDKPTHKKEFGFDSIHNSKSYRSTHSPHFHESST